MLLYIFLHGTGHRNDAGHNGKRPPATESGLLSVWVRGDFNLCKRKAAEGVLPLDRCRPHPADAIFLLNSHLSSGSFSLCQAFPGQSEAPEPWCPDTTSQYSSGCSKRSWGLWVGRWELTFVLASLDTCIPWRPLIRPRVPSEGWIPWSDPHPHP